MNKKTLNKIVSHPNFKDITLTEERLDALLGLDRSVTLKVDVGIDDIVKDFGKKACESVKEPENELDIIDHVINYLKEYGYAKHSVLQNGNTIFFRGDIEVTVKETKYAIYLNTNHGWAIGVSETGELQGLDKWLGEIKESQIRQAEENIQPTDHKALQDIIDNPSYKVVDGKAINLKEYKASISKLLQENGFKQRLLKGTFVKEPIHVDIKKSVVEMSRVRNGSIVCFNIDENIIDEIQRYIDYTPEIDHKARVIKELEEIGYEYDKPEGSTDYVMSMDKYPSVRVYDFEVQTNIRIGDPNRVEGFPIETFNAKEWFDSLGNRPELENKSYKYNPEKPYEAYLNIIKDLGFEELNNKEGVAKYVLKDMRTYANWLNKKLIIFFENIIIDKIESIEASKFTKELLESWMQE
jgi:hypothetical protein